MMAKLYKQWIPIFLMVGLMVIGGGVMANQINPKKGWNANAGAVMATSFITIIGSAASIVRDWNKK